MELGPFARERAEVSNATYQEESVLDFTMESNPICMKPPFNSLVARYFDSSSQQRPDQQSYVRTLNLFARENTKKTGLKSLDFFSLQP